MAISRWKKFKNVFLYCLILAGFPLLAWVAYSYTTEAYQYWKYGIEKPAKVVALDRTSSSSRGGTSYYYQLEIDGKPVVERFRVRLPVGKTVSVLALPDEPDNVVLGTKESTWFELYSYSLGSSFMGAATLVMFAFMLVWGPNAFVLMIRNRHAIFDSEE